MSRPDPRVQVKLTDEERRLVDELSRATGLSRSDVLRWGLRNIDRPRLVQEADFPGLTGRGGRASL
jgi:Ribbon-helix-helix protein, copG family